jgi:hypothetical protein
MRNHIGDKEPSEKAGYVLIPFHIFCFWDKYLLVQIWSKNFVLLGQTSQTLHQWVLRTSLWLTSIATRKPMVARLSNPGEIKLATKFPSVPQDL